MGVLLVVEKITLAEKERGWNTLHIFPCTCPTES